MLFSKNSHRIVKNIYIIQTALFGAFALVMEYAAGGKIIIPVAGFQNAIGPIDVFAVHKKIFVQQTGFNNCLSTD
jgi:hypothetical protein